MTTAEPKIIARSSEQAHIWINDVADALGEDVLAVLPDTLGVLIEA